MIIRNISKFGKVVNLSFFSFVKRHMHIYSMSVTLVQSFKLFAWKNMWKELII